MMTYLIVAALMLYTDALLCHAVKRRFNLPFAVPCALAWPVTLPIMVIGCAYLTRDFPKPATPAATPTDGGEGES